MSPPPPHTHTHTNTHTHSPPHSWDFIGPRQFLSGENSAWTESHKRIIIVIRVLPTATNSAFLIFCFRGSFDIIVQVLFKHKLARNLSSKLDVYLWFDGLCSAVLRAWRWSESIQIRRRWDRIQKTSTLLVWLFFFFFFFFFFSFFFLSSSSFSSFVVV